MAGKERTDAELQTQVHALEQENAQLRGQLREAQSVPVKMAGLLDALARRTAEPRTVSTGSE